MNGLRALDNNNFNFLSGLRTFSRVSSTLFIWLTGSGLIRTRRNTQCALVPERYLDTDLDWLWFGSAGKQDGTCQKMWRASSQKVAQVHLDLGEVNHSSANQR